MACSVFFRQVHLDVVNHLNKSTDYSCRRAGALLTVVSFLDNDSSKAFGNFSSEEHQDEMDAAKSIRQKMVQKMEAGPMPSPEGPLVDQKKNGPMSLVILITSPRQYCGRARTW